MVRVIPTIGARALNRATLARQQLLKRSSMSALEFTEHAFGLQAQAPMAPYFALWARLKNFAPEQLSELLLSRSAVRIVVMRGTVHLLAADDARLLRPLVQPVLDRDLRLNALHAAGLEGIDHDELAAAGRALVEETPLTAAELRPLLGERWPDRDSAALAHGVRGLLPLVQVPPRGIWGKAGQPTLTTLEHWLGREPLANPSLDAMVLRYLAAYGPASIQDVQAWSGLTRLGEVVERIRSQLVVLRSESGTELFDLPDAPRPGPDVVAPVRILAPFDNLLLSYADRTRVLDEEYKAALFTQNGIIKPAVLVNGRAVGFVAITKTKGAVLLEVSLFTKIAKSALTALEKEGHALLRFAHPDAGSYEVRVG